MTLTRERSQVREEQRLEAREVLPRAQMPTSLAYWLIALLVVAAVAVAVWLIPTSDEAELGEPITLQEFAMLEDQLVRDPGVEIPGWTIEEFAHAEDLLTRELMPPMPVEAEE